MTISQVTLVVAGIEAFLASYARPL